MRRLTGKHLGIVFLGLLVLVAVVFISLGKGDLQVSWLLAKMNWPHWLVQRSAMDELASLGERATPAVRSLAACLEDERPQTRRHAAWVLGEIGPPALDSRSALARALQHDDPGTRLAAALALGSVDPGNALARDAVLELVQTADDDIRGWAAHRLREQGRRAVPALTRAVRDPHPLVRWNALSSLGAIGPPALPALESVLDVLTHGTSDEKALAARTLGRMEARDAETIQALIQAVETEVGYTASDAASTLGQIGPDAAAAVPALMTLYRHPRGDPDVQTVCVDAFRALGAKAHDAMPLLLGALDDPYEDLGPLLTTAIQQIDPDSVPHAVDRLLHALEGGNAASAATRLGEFGTSASPAVPALLRLLESKEDAARSSAALALGRIGAQPARCVPALMRALETSPGDAKLRLSAVIALGRFGTHAAQAVPALEGARTDRDARVASTAAAVLSNLTDAR